ncbi:MAG: poly-gamma-glutamate biosynthesis protein PgsC/CapC [Caldilineaceae bacterium]|nr:poly-gamma-glutamate biosynthesis protein PgsC/CapC [Caldilineaceae bacterium]
MHNYAFDTELARLAIALGVAASMIYYERFGVTTGGVIIPGYLALFVTQPSQIVVTLLVGMATFWIVQRILRPRLMLWGRRLYEAEVLTALVIQLIWGLVLMSVAPLAPAILALYGIGFVLPGIVAHDMGRQGVRATITAAVICALAVFGLVVVVESLRSLWSIPAWQTAPAVTSRMQRFAYPVEWLPVGVTLSVVVSMMLYHQVPLFQGGLLPESLRAGGVVTAGYLALFMLRPLDLLFVTVSSLLTYVIVTQVFMRWTILFGRSKVAAMFLTALLITWLLELAIGATGVGYIPWRGFNIIVPTVVALLANDSQRQGLRRTVIGTVMATVAVFVLMLGIQWVVAAVTNAWT